MLSMLRNLGGYLAARYDLRNERGATMVEYGLMVAFIAIVVGAAAALLGGEIRDLFGGADTAVDAVPTTGLTPAPAD